MSADADGRRAVFDGEATSVQPMQFCIREILEGWMPPSRRWAQSD